MIIAAPSAATQALDCKPLGPFAGSVKVPHSAVSGPPRTFAAAIERFNAEQRDPSECVFLWKLLEAACEQTGAPLSKPVLAGRADATASYQEFQATLKGRRGAKARGGPSLEALLAGLGEAGHAAAGAELSQPSTD